MNCTDFKHQLLVDPRSDDPEFAEHARDCPDCAAERSRALDFESVLRNALLVEAPGSSRHDVPRPILLIAALSLLSVWAIWWLSMRQPAMVELERSIVAHIAMEPETLTARGPVSRAKLGDLMDSIGARWDADSESVRYASACHIGRHAGVHLVLAGSSTPITAFVLGERLVEREQRLEGANLEGVSMPTDYGTLIVVVSRGEPLAPEVTRLASAIQAPY